MTILRPSSLLQAAVAQLIAYVSDAGDSLGTICVDRAYVRLAPDDAVTPYLVLQKTNGETDPDFDNLREEFDLEALCVDGDPIKAELMADLAREAFLTWRESSAASGLVHVLHVKRETEPAGDAVTRDRVEVLVIARCASWSRSLSDALT